MILDTVKSTIRKALDEEKDRLLQSLVSNPATTAEEAWKAQFIIYQCIEIDTLKTILNRALDIKEEELQKKD